jgi:hypothetical protein
MAEKTIISPGDELWGRMPADLKGHVNACIAAKCERDKCDPRDLDVRVECVKGQVPLIRIKRIGVQ